jgi:hypothetical protein
MRHLIRLRPSPAMVVACLALGLALGGTSYAAVKLPRNSVGTKQLKKNAVTGPKVKDDSVTGADVKESSLAKVPAAVAADTAALATTATTATTAGNANTVGGATVKRYFTAVTNGAAAATVLNLNGLILTLTCPAGATSLRANNNSGAAAQFRFEGQGTSTGAFGGGAQNLGAAANLQINVDNIGSGAAHYIRLNGTGVTAHYGYRNDDFAGLGVACRVFGYAVSG